MPSYDAIVLSGAGTSGSVFLGSVHRLQELEYLKDCNTFVGTSIGSLIAALLALKHNPVDLQEKILGFDISSLFQFSWNPLIFLRGYGFSSANNLEKLIKYLLGDDKDITFKQLKEKTGNRLCITGTDLVTQSAKYFDVDTSPDMPVWLACRISSSLPLIWPAVSYEGGVYIDGSFSDNLALEYFTNEENVVALRFSNVLVSPVYNFVDFLKRVVGAAISHIIVDKRDNTTIVPLNVFASPTDFNVSKAALQDIYAQGYNLTKQFFSQL
jgi:predicted acylesterase/phospholipase RssA